MSDRPLCVLDHDQRPAEAAHGLLCRWHRRQLDEHTTEIGHLIVDSMRVRDGGAPREQSPKTRHLKSADAPAPGDLGIMALYDSRTKTQRLPGSVDNPDGDQSEPLAPVIDLVAEHAYRIRDERQLTEWLPSCVVIRRNRARQTIPERLAPLRLPNSVLGQLDFIARHADWVAAQEWVPDLLTELAEVRKQLRVAVHDQTAKVIGNCDLPADTGPCGGALVVENGSSVIRCTRCREQWVTAQEHARLAVRLDNTGVRA